MTPTTSCDERVHDRGAGGEPEAPSIATLLVPLGPVAIGTPVFDTAVLTGATATAGGTVTYTVYTNDTCTANPVPAGTKTVTDGVVPQSDPVTFTTAGTFFWQAVYSGTPTTSLRRACAPTETLVVSPNAPSIATLLCRWGRWRSAPRCSTRRC